MIPKIVINNTIFLKSIPIGIFDPFCDMAVVVEGNAVMAVRFCAPDPELRPELGPDVDKL